jgi:CheY-like chemotaxis protein
VLTAAGGTEAIRMMRNEGAARLVLLDLGLPDVDIGQSSAEPPALVRNGASLVFGIPLGVL